MNFVERTSGLHWTVTAASFGLTFFSLLNNFFNTAKFLQKSIIFIFNLFRTHLGWGWGKPRKRHFISLPLNQYFQNQTWTVFNKVNISREVLWYYFSCLKVGNCVPCWCNFWHASLVRAWFTTWLKSLGAMKFIDFKCGCDVGSCHKGIQLGDPEAAITEGHGRSDLWLAMSSVVSLLQSKRSFPTINCRM